MDYFEFVKRRRSSKYKDGDHVWFRHVARWDDRGLPVEVIESGVILWCENYESAFYGIRPDSTLIDTYCAISVRKEDMRKFRKNEVV